MSEHTKGRLRVGKPEECGGYVNADLFICTEDGSSLGEMISGDPFIGTDESKANARRLVACWNACEGIGTEYLETTTSLREADIRRKVELERDRDELIVELDRLVADVENKWNDPHTLRHAKEALALVCYSIAEAMLAESERRSSAPGATNEGRPA